MEAVQRYERERPGELTHIDVKKLNRIRGGAGKRVFGGQLALQPHLHRPGRQAPQHGRRDAIHIAVDDATRLAYAEVVADEKAATTLAFVACALAFYCAHLRLRATQMYRREDGELKVAHRHADTVAD